MTRILYLFPPNYRAINAAFNVRGKGIIFAYGGAIYNPDRIKVTDQLIAHERVHLGRQSDPDAWWRAYIADPAFRLAEEIPAHRAECLAGTPLDHAARRLSGPIYGGLVDFARARELILDNGGGTTETTGTALR